MRNRKYHMSVLISFILTTFSDGNKIMLFSRHQDDSARLKKEKRKEARKRRSERQRIKKEQMKAEKIALKKEKKKEIWNKLKDIANKSGIEGMLLLETTSHSLILF